MKDYLGFTVLAAVVTTIGTLFGLFLKDFLFVYFFDNLREKRTLEKISKKYKDPILLSAVELTRRVNDYSKSFNSMSKYSTTDILFDKVDKMQFNNSTDPYYLKYKLISTLYRFCCFFAWLELYRQEITFLDSHSKGKSSEVLTLIANIREAVADGQINTNIDWNLWVDAPIFREELRAIGEGMIENNKEQRAIIGYGKFRTIIGQFETVKEPFWIGPVIIFFTDLKTESDFRQERFKRITVALIELVKCLDKEFYEHQLKPSLQN
jgi:hypothetical protein